MNMKKTKWWPAPQVHHHLVLPMSMECGLDHQVVLKNKEKKNTGGSEHY
jgi:hypothetical protein